MIPNGLNPHGLEDKTLTFCVLENNLPTFTCQSKNRLYCWAMFSDQIKNHLWDTYGVADCELSTEVATDPESWERLRKYVSKGVDGDHFMVHGNQTFYYQTWQPTEIPKFATVYILDTSGSMQSDDYTQAKRCITGEIYEYNCFDAEASDSRMYVYSAAYLSSMSIYESVFGTIPFGQASLSTIWDSVSPFIDGIKHNSSSEAMVTNLYYSIASTIHKMFYDEGHTNPGKGCELSSVSFLLMTDESVFTSDSLNDVGLLTRTTSEYYSSWFSEWQANADNGFLTNKVMLTERQWDFCKAISDALKQMSYYYGVNFNWGLYGGLAVSNDAKYIKDVYNRSGQVLSSPGTAFWLNKVTKLEPETGTITYINNADAWEVPVEFHVDYPHSPMCRIGLVVPIEYIEGESAFKDTLVMQYEHQFVQNQALAHFHKDSNNEYSAFRFLRTGYDASGRKYTFADQPVPLPNTADMNLKTTNPATGQPYVYNWQTYGQREEFPSKLLSPGTSYNVDYQDVAATGQLTIMFKLVGT